MYNLTGLLLKYLAAGYCCNNSRRGIVQLESSFGSIILLFSMKVGEGLHSNPQPPTLSDSLDLMPKFESII